MRIPPLWIKLRIIEAGRKKIGLWIPLFIIGPIVLIAGIILFPLVLIASILLWPTGKGKSLLLAMPMILYLCCSMAGLKIDVNSGKDRVFINIK